MLAMLLKSPKMRSTGCTRSPNNQFEYGWQSPGLSRIEKVSHLPTAQIAFSKTMIHTASVQPCSYSSCQTEVRRTSNSPSTHILPERTWCMARCPLEILDPMQPAQSTAFLPKNELPWLTSLRLEMPAISRSAISSLFRKTSKWLLRVEKIEL